MIAFKSRNIDEETRCWIFDSVEVIEKAWNSEDMCDLPANDDPIWDVVIDDKAALEEATFERIDTDPIWFEDLLTYLGIEIW